MFIDVISKNYYFIDSFDSINGQSVSITTTLHGVETTEVVSQYDGMHYMPFLSSIKNGRGINWGDIQSKEKTVMIDEYTAELLYGSIKDAIGQSIVIDGGRGLVSEQTSSSPQKHSFIISGVCENSKLTEHNRVENRKKIKKGSDNVIINIDLYCPISTIFDLYPDLDYYRNYIVTFGSQNEANDFYNKTIDTNGNQYGISYIVSKDSLMADITLQMKETKRIIVLGILLLSFIFGISIISVVFFATKERIPEIGIRKAFGAEKLDIVFQIFCEMLLISGLASIIGVFAALYFSKLLEYYLINELCIYFVLNITAGDIVTPIFVGVLQSAIFGMIPGIYGASIPITDALKFE